MAAIRGLRLGGEYERRAPRECARLTRLQVRVLRAQAGHCERCGGMAGDVVQV
jgi:hypothetical protein